MINKYDREKILFIQGFNDNDSKTLSENYPNLIVFSEEGKNIYKNGVSYTSAQNINPKNNSFIFDDNIISLELDSDDILLSLYKNSIDTKRYFYTGINIPNLEWKTNNELNHYNVKNNNIEKFKTINDFLDNSTIYESLYNYCLFIDSLEDNNTITFTKINNNDASITYKTIRDNDFTTLSLSNNIQYDVTLGNGERLYISEVKNVNITSTHKFNISGDLNFTDEENNKFNKSINGSNLSSLFKGAKVVDASKLILYNTLTEGCYKSMFEDCTELIATPKLSVTELKQSCYESMFKGCTSLTTAPDLPATTLKTNCYKEMFYGCENLKYIKASFIDIKENNYPYTENWVNGVAEHGTFIKSNDWNVYNNGGNIKQNILGNSGIPELWVDENGYKYSDNFYNMYLTIECVSEPVTLQWPGNNYDRIDYNNTNNNYSTLQYSYDRNNWETISSNNINKIQLNNNDNHNKVYLRGNNNSYEQLSLGDCSNVIECKYKIDTEIDKIKICKYIFNKNNETFNLKNFIDEIIIKLKYIEGKTGIQGENYYIKNIDYEIENIVNDYFYYSFNENVEEYTVKFILKDDCKTIPDEMFKDCIGLNSIIIPNAVKSMGDNIFNGCNNLTSITCDSSEAPEISSKTFNNINTENNVILYIPNGWDLNNVDVPEFVDFGLPSRTLWATKNLGAQTENDFGYYYQWASKHDDYFKQGVNFSQPQYNTTDAAKLKTNIIPGGIYDTATSSNKNYQMPTRENFNELINKCTWEPYNINNAFGYKIFNTNNDSYIFLPAAGNHMNQNDNMFARYWSSNINSGNNDYAINLYFGTNFINISTNAPRYIGYSIRPVMRRTNDVNKCLWKKIFDEKQWTITESDNINNNKGTFKVYGNIMSLFYGDDFINKTEFPSNSSHNLRKFFSNTNIVDASNLILPENPSSEDWNELMFNDCNHLDLEKLPRTNNSEITPIYDEDNEETFELDLTGNYRKYIFTNDNGYQCFILMPVEWENHLIVNFNNEKWGNIFNIQEISKIKQNIVLNDGCKYNLYATNFNCKNIIYEMSSI